MTTKTAVKTAAKADAEARAERIRTTLNFAWKEILPDLVAAYAARDWETLGYDDWGAYVAGQFGAHLPRFSSTDERTATIMDFTAAGLSTRSTAAATGTSKDTVNRAVNAAAVADETPVFTQPEGTFLRAGPATKPDDGLYRAGKVDMSGPVRWVATKLDEAAPAALSVKELMRGYTDHNGGDYARIKRTEKGIDPKEWIIRQAIRELGSQLVVDGDDTVSLAEGRRIADLIWRRPGDRDKSITPYGPPIPPVDPDNLKPWQTEEPPVDLDQYRTPAKPPKKVTGQDGKKYAAKKPAKKPAAKKPAAAKAASAATTKAAAEAEWARVFAEDLIPVMDDIARIIGTPPAKKAPDYQEDHQMHERSRTLLVALWASGAICNNDDEQADWLRMVADEMDLGGGPAEDAPAQERLDAACEKSDRMDAALAALKVKVDAASAECDRLQAEVDKAKK